MGLLANIFPSARGLNPLMLSIRRPQGMSLLTFALIGTFAYRTLNGKGILGRALSGKRMAPARKA